MPDGMSGDIDAPIDASGWDDSNSVVLVGGGSLGDSAQTSPEQVTRAYLNPIGKTGRSAWWIGPENQKARIDLAKQPRDLSADAWETAQGDTAEVGVGALPGLDALDSDASLGDKLVTRQTLRPAGIDRRPRAETFLRSDRIEPGRAGQRAHRASQEGPEPAFRETQIRPARSLPVRSR